jgi:hypothetical protein
MIKEVIEASPEPIARDEMRAKLDGKTKDEVLALLGKPGDNDEGAAPSWAYKRRTFDPVSGQVDPIMRIYWDKHGRVERVSF